jgi:hypothetical protein
MTDDLEIPTFLRRGHPDCIVKEPELAVRDEFPEGPAPQIRELCKQILDDCSIGEPDNAKRKLNAAFRSRVAMAIIGQVKAGADTFGKLRKALPDYSDRELKSGIRYAEKWMPMLERRGTKRKPVMHRYQARVERRGKRYSVVTY